MLVFNKTNDRRQTLIIMNDMPNAIDYHHGEKSKAFFSDGSCSSMACLGCISPKCMYFSNEEIHCDSIPSFPSDNTNSVCPTAAISIEQKTGIPRINSDKCIKCGICLNRCPVGAIYYADEELKINSELSNKQCVVPYSSENEHAHRIQIENLSVCKTGIPILESDGLLFEIYQKLFKIDYRLDNLIARNLLISLGCKCSIRRIGDVYTRMDAFYSALDKSIGTVEVEFGRDTLEAARAILEDIAVSNVRYGIPKDTNLPLVVCLQLPNARQGYWQVVKDIKNVEDIVINTVTVGTLIILCWNRCSISPTSISYYIDYDNMDLRKIITTQLGREIKISNKLLGLMEPNK